MPVWQRPGLGGAVRPEMGAPQPGEAAPDFTLPDDRGGEVRLSALRGHWVLLHFTASWCPYCDSEIEHLGRLADSFAPRGVRVVLIDVEQPASVWLPYAATHVAPHVLSARDESGQVAARFAPPRAQPAFTDRAQATLDATLIIDPAGTIRLFLLPDTAHFDPKFRAVEAELSRLTEDAAPAQATAESRAPTELLTPEQSVAVSLTPLEPLACGVKVSLQVAPGYHIMSDHPSEPQFIATRVLVESPDMALAAPLYPRALPFAALGKTLSTFQGKSPVSVPCQIGTAAKASAPLVEATVRYQACTTTSCLFPITRHFSQRIALHTNDAAAPAP
ncbi:MAG TPA: redoxin domain-containing protein [Polyangiaceae bacterium]|nr:redoxin domain-containing protein [Polyangiaceae bacterium]